jgi:serine/threonine protein kinase
MALAAGARVGPYEIVGILGAGGMGVVYRARDVRLERNVALKFLHGSDDASGSRSRLMREARAASALNHPHICAVYDVGELNGDAYIAMEYVEGGSLGAGIPAGGYDTATVIRRAIETADALAHAHRRGIIHRDLKSANILCDAEGRLKVLDFGLAHRLPSEVVDQVTRSVNSLDASGVIAGTLTWMAPEVLRGAPADVRSDLWALGILIHELSTGTLPFGGQSSFEIASRILNDPAPPLPSGMPQALREVTAKLLEKDPDARYQSAAEVRAALEVIARGTQGDGSAAPTQVSPAMPPRRRRRAAVLWTSALAALAIGLAAVAWSMLQSGDESGLRLYDQRLVSTDVRSEASPSLSPDGRTVAFVAPDDKQVAQIWIQTLAQEDAVQITTGSVAAARPRWLNNDEIVLARRGEGIWTVGRLGGTPSRILAAGSNPNLSADGSRLVYEHEHRIWVARADGSGARLLGHVPAKYYSIPATPAFSPDGRRLVYFRPDAGPNGDFWIASVDGSEPPRRLTTDLREGASPVWTRDDIIIFSSARGGSRTLWKVPAAGGTPEPLTTGAGEDDEPELSRDGTRLLYSNVRNSWELIVGDPDGRSDRTLLERRTEMIFPQFAPDGTRITFFARNDRAVAIFTINSDGTVIRALTGGTELNHMPRWSADGASVYFFQISPELSFRRVPAVGGASTAVLPLKWETHNFPSFDPTGRLMAYTLNRLSSESQTMVRDLTSDTERVIPGPALRYPRWSRDGRQLAGWLNDGTIALCDVAVSSCRSVTEGYMPAWSGDGSRLYFLRAAQTEPRAMPEMWSVRPDGSDLRLHRRVGGFRTIDVFFDVSRQNQIVWAAYRPGRRELWAATVR